MNDQKTELGAWVGRERVMSDVVSADRLLKLSATLDRADPEPRPGDPLPPCWHWMFFQDATPLAEVGPDGHAKRGVFMPPIDKPRRMWAGSRIRFIDVPRVGETMQRLTRIATITEKAGKTGSLVFVTLLHEISTARGPAIREEQDLVYRDLSPKNATRSDTPFPTGVAVWRRSIKPDPVLLFRYSALTFNSHRIHYDRSYCVEAEGHPGLVVHGPLTATLLVDLARREQPSARIASFEFRAVSPLFDTAPFVIAGRPSADQSSASVWAAGPAGALAMSGDLVFS